MTRLMILLPVAALFAALAQVLIKTASLHDLYQYGFSRKTIVLLLCNPQLWFSGIFYLGSFLLSIKIFELSRLSIITPVFMGLVLLFVVNFSCVFFDDQLTARVFIGQIIILFGAFIVLSSA